MVINNYWWLLIWIMTGGILVGNVIPQEQVSVCGKMEKRYSLFSAIAIFFPYFLWAGCRNDTIGDTWNYRTQFLEAPTLLTEAWSFVAESTKDKGFSLLIVAIKNLFGNSDLVFFLIIAAFQAICIISVYRKYSCDYWISIFLFVISTDYLSWMHNGMRQFIAVAGIFACTTLMLKKKYIPLVIVILLLSTIHGSALIMLPIVFIAQGKAWNKRTIVFIVGIVVALAFVDQFTSIMDVLISNTQYDNMMTNEIWTGDDGTNIIRVFVYSIPAILSLVGRKYIEYANDPVVNLSCNMSIVSAAIYLLSSGTSGIYIGRLPIYCSLYSYILLPWLLKNMFTKNSQRLLYIIMIGAYMVFFYYQVHYAWGLL